MLFYRWGDKVLDTLKKFHISENIDRTLFLGENLFKTLNMIKKILPTELNKDKFDNLLASGNVFSNEIEGVGKYLNNIKSFEEFTNI